MCDIPILSVTSLLRIGELQLLPEGPLTNADFDDFCPGHVLAHLIHNEMFSATVVMHIRSMHVLPEFDFRIYIRADLKMSLHFHRSNFSGRSIRHCDRSFANFG